MTVTISCRVTPEQKFALVQRSEKLGMKLCKYVEMMVLKGFEEEQSEAKENTENTSKEAAPTASITIDTVIRTTSPTKADIFEKYMLDLQERYPDSSEVELVNACVIHAFSNRKAWHQKSLKTYLKRLKKGQYDD